jgi:hypothetical protein
MWLSTCKYEESPDCMLCVRVLGYRYNFPVRASKSSFTIEGGNGSKLYSGI